MNNKNQHEPITTKSFIKKCSKIHNSKYNYSLVTYINSTTKIKIICPDHGVFEQTPNKHQQGRNCPKCGNMNRCRFPKQTTEEFIEKSKQKHGNKYKYEKVDYLRNHTKVTITCLIHGDFKQTPAMHKSGQGCPQCKITGYQINKPGLLYYICIDNFYYKIGITNRTIEERFSKSDKNRIRIIKLWNYDKGKICYNKEQSIIKEFQEFKFKGEVLLESVKNTEIFIKDILELDSTKSGSGNL